MSIIESNSINQKRPENYVSFSGGQTREKDIFEFYSKQIKDSIENPDDF